MARKTERVTIGGSQFVITQLGAVEGRGLQKKFSDAIAPLLREVVSGPLLEQAQKLLSGAGEDDPRKQSEALLLFAPVIIKAYEQIPNALHQELCEAFSRNCEVVMGQPAVPMPLTLMFDEHFAGDYQSLNAWLVQCIRFNGFLANLGGASSGAPAQATP